MKKLNHNHLAEGERTGHYHAVEGVTSLMELEDGTRLFAVPDGGTTITHQEHKHVALEAGEYASGRVREMDHFSEEARQVAD